MFLNSYWLKESWKQTFSYQINSKTAWAHIFQATPTWFFFTILFSFSVPISFHRLIFNRVIGFSGGIDPGLWILNIVVIFFIENMPLIKYLLGWLLETWKELYKGKIWKLKSYHHFGYLLLPISCNLFLFFFQIALTPI